MLNLSLACVAREMHPPIPRRENVFHELSTREIHPSPYFSLANLIEFLLLERLKNRIIKIYHPNILNLQPRTMETKENIKKSN